MNKIEQELMMLDEASRERMRAEIVGTTRKRLWGGDRHTDKKVRAFLEGDEGRLIYLNRNQVEYLLNSKTDEYVKSQLGERFTVDHLIGQYVQRGLTIGEHRAERDKLERRAAKAERKLAAALDDHEQDRARLNGINDKHLARIATLEAQLAAAKAQTDIVLLARIKELENIVELATGHAQRTLKSLAKANKKEA